jgi:hypothetical protein
MSDNKDQVMVDFSGRDPRSFKAFLRGSSDGRHQLYNKMFAQTKPASETDLQDLSAKFGAVAWETAVAQAEAANLAYAKAAKADVVPSVSLLEMVPRFFVSAVGLLLGVMLYQAFFGH